MPTEITTANNAFRVPTAANDGVDFATGLDDFATDVDGMWRSGMFAARPVASKANREYYGTDTGRFYRDTGSAWLTLLTLGLGPASAKATSGAVTANAGDWIIATGGGYTITLPTPAANALVAVTAVTATGVFAVTIAGAANSIHGVGLPNTGATSILLGTIGATVVLQSDGTSWYIIAGQQDTGWLTITPTAGYNGSQAGNYVASVRVRGDQAMLKGSIVSNSTNNAFGTVPTVARASAQVTFGAIVSTGSGALFGYMPTTGVLTSGGTVASGYAMELDGLTYSLS